MGKPWQGLGGTTEFPLPPASTQLLFERPDDPKFGGQFKRFVVISEERLRDLIDPDTFDAIMAICSEES